MNAPQLFFLGKILFKETLAQALSSRLFFLVAGYSLFLLFLAGSVRLHNLPSDDKASGEPWTRTSPTEKERIGEEKMKEEGVLAPSGEIHLLFGTIRVPWNHFKENAIRFLQGLAGFFVADWPGVLIALLWTGSFIPEFRTSGLWMLVATRPVSPGITVLLKAVAVIFLLMLQGGLLLICTWLLLGISTGVWPGLFLWLAPLLLAQFLTFYPISVFLGAWTKNGMVAVGGVVAFWAICWVVNLSYISLIQKGVENPANSTVTSLSSLAYWILPKPIDFSILLAWMTGAMADVPMPNAWQKAWSSGAIHPLASIITSLIIPALLVFLTWFETNQEKDLT